MSLGDYSQWWWQGALVALFVWNIVLFSVALKRNFSRPEGVPRLMRALALCGAASALTDGILLCMSKPVLWQVLSGAVLLIVSQVLFRTAIGATQPSKLSLAFSGDAPASLNQSGPYRFIRHPFYTAYSLTWLAAVIATAHPAACVAMLTMMTFYWTAARREERKFLSSPLAAAYRRYQKFTGMFLPYPSLQQNNTTPNT